MGNGRRVRSALSAKAAHSRGVVARAAMRATLMAGLATALAAGSAELAAQDTAPRPGQKVALITGSTDGLGREVALQLAREGMHIIVHGRNEERGREVVRMIQEAGSTARFIRADLASLAEVRELAAAVLRDYDRLDLLINNAGIGRGPDGAQREVSVDGYELRFAVNYLSHFLLTHQLLPLLEKSAPSKIVNVSSTAQNPIDFDDVMLEKAPYQGARAYGQSKLAQIMMTIDLAQELEGRGVTVNAVHPATYMNTSMVLNRGGTPMATVEEGRDAVMNVIKNPEVKSGEYWMGQRLGRPNAQANDPEARARLRRLAMELTGLN